MYRKTFKIKKAFLVAFSVDVVLLCLLLLLSLFFKGSSLERLVLAVIFITALLIFLESLSRKVLTGDQGILIRKFLRDKKLLWEDITQVGTVVMRKRVYLLLTTTKGFHILTNAYGEFPGLLREIADHVERERIDDEVRNQIDHPVKKISDIVSACFAAAVLVAIIVFKIITS
ncbi:MAG: hypothetical protein NTZ24_01175 [Deltaproteobacteria bacterium]|nr:hypothetical protein [Deltaproteobacteria bacterium]